MTTDKFRFTKDTDLENNPILVCFFGAPGTGPEIVKAIHENLPKVGLHGGPLIKVDGACTVAGAYVIAAALKPKYGVIAVADPKISDIDCKRFIVVISQTSAYSVGDILEDFIVRENDFIVQ